MSSSIFRCCEGDRSWSKITRSASVEAIAPCNSSSLPLPINVAGSGRSRRCSISPATEAPALRVSSRSSSSASSGKASECASAADTAAAALRAIFALGGRGDCASDLRSGGPLRNRRLENSTPTRKARSCCGPVVALRSRCASYAKTSEFSSLPGRLRRAILTFRLCCRRRRANRPHVRVPHLAAMCRSRQHHGRYRMLEDQLFLVVGIQHDGILVEGTNTASQLHPTQEVNRDNRFVFPGRVEK